MTVSLMSTKLLKPIVGLLGVASLAACGSTDGLVALAPEDPAAATQLVVGPDTTIQDLTVETLNPFTQRQGSILLEVTYPEFASPGDTVRVTGRLQFSQFGTARVETRVTGPNFEIEPSFSTTLLGCGTIVTLYTFRNCTIERTFVVPPEAGLNATYTFEARVVPVVGAALLPAAATISGTVLVVDDAASRRAQLITTRAQF